MKSLSLVGWLPVLAVAFVLASCNDPRQPIMTKEQKAKVGKHLLASANPQHKLGARFDNKLELVGVDLSSQRLNVGQRLQITYYWKCLGKINGDWKIFVHWDMRGRIGDDHYPIGGLFRFNRCQPGKIVRDIRSMVASRRLGNGGVSRVYVGVYNPKILDPSGRMRLTNPRPGWTLNRVIAATITVGRGVTRPTLPIPSYTVRPLEGTLTIDGKLDDEAWKKAETITRLVHPHGRGPVPLTQVKFLYDDKYLYVAWNCLNDRNIWNSVKDKDGQTWNQDVVEVFIDADGDQKTYVELQVTPSNVIFDAFFKTRQQPDWRIARKWDSKMETAVHVDGTANKDGDTDKSWSVEMKIPIASLKPYIKNVPPKIGDVWRVNLFRRDHTPRKGGRPLDLFGAWSAPLSGSFHTLERFGYLKFGGKRPAVVKTTPKKGDDKGAPKKSDPKKGDKQPAPKKGDKKPGSKVEVKKGAPKMVEKKPAPKKDEKKPAPKKDETKPSDKK